MHLSDKDRAAVIEALEDLREQYKAWAAMGGFFEWMDKSDAMKRAVDALAATAPTPDEIVRMTLQCDNVEIGRDGWYALRIDKANGCKETVGRGATAWDAVRNAHAG